MTTGQGSPADTEGIAKSQKKMQGNLENQMDPGQRASPSQTWNDNPERQMTECLNNAAAQRMSLDTCRR
jgi:hypothetical protein